MERMTLCAPQTKDENERTVESVDRMKLNEKKVASCKKHRLMM